MNIEVKKLIIEDFLKVSLIFYKIVFQNLPIKVAEKEKKIPKIQVFKAIAKNKKKRRNKF